MCGILPLFFLCIVQGRAWKASSESCAFCKRNKKHPPWFPGSILFVRAFYYWHPGALWWHQEKTFWPPARWEPATLRWTHLSLHWTGKPEHLLYNFSKELKLKPLWCTAQGKEVCWEWQALLYGTFLFQHIEWEHVARRYLSAPRTHPVGWFTIFLEDTAVSAGLGGSWELSAPLKT